MKIKERIITLIEEQKDEKSANLWNICQKIIDNINAHNKQIIAQMQEYDTHDQEHSEKVLEIMENILDPTTIEKMSFYELILLYMSAYLHDSAMAMPNWEYTLLRAVEGTEEYNDSTLSFKICNDYKRVHTFSEALDMVQNNKDKLFDYEKARQYVCMKPTEEALIESLAELMCSYEEFRNGYTEELDGCKDSVSKYMNKSKFIRSEFIRQTHHIRVVDNVYALKGKIADAIGGFYAESFVEDLAAVCRCHGEKLEKIFELPIARKDWSDENANIQFLAILLRLGDVIHFDSERAPMSLYAEKQISDAESYKHWNAKFQELQYTVHNENSKVSIRYQAYCREPEMYYFIQDYLDGIDNEIDNYYILKNRWELIQNRELERYYLNIDKVDRTQIKYDRDRFVPDKNMKFVLNQSKILELLMGIQLYKDKFLCIREIYQNALDASKCMKAYNRKLGKTENLTIQFGVGVEEIQGKTEKYIYCLDHGTGMNKYIIRNYLLHIGNSYYRSKEFAKKNTDWGYDVNPTSQFGIGLLSGYMLADKIGITTIHYEDNKALSFVYCWLYSAMCKYTLHTSKGNTIHTRRDDRRHTYECMKYGINDSFLSTSLRLDSNQYFQKKDGLVLMEFEAEDTVEHINVNDVLGDKSGFPQEDEILYPPFIYLETKPLTLEESEKSFQDCHKAPPCGKYFITLKSSSIEPKERSKETTEWLDQKRKELTAKTEIENAKKVWNAITINAECAYKAEIQQYVNWKQGLKEYLKTIYAIIKYEQR